MSAGFGPWPRRAALAASVLLFVTAVSGTLASNVVAASRVGHFAMATGANDLKPVPECSGITVTTIEPGSGSFSASNLDDLVLGSAGVDDINARNGNDCVIGGSGNDAINGGNHNDVCIGGLGTDTFSSCETVIQ
jgi:Ca2+-binding RTX toxin-like protein